MKGQGLLWQWLFGLEVFGLGSLWLVSLCMAGVLVPRVIAVGAAAAGFVVAGVCTATAARSEGNAAIPKVLVQVRSNGTPTDLQNGPKDLRT